MLRNVSDINNYVGIMASIIKIDIRKFLKKPSVKFKKVITLFNNSSKVMNLIGKISNVSNILLDIERMRSGDKEMTGWKFGIDLGIIGISELYAPVGITIGIANTIYPFDEAISDGANKIEEYNSILSSGVSRLYGVPGY